MYNGVSKELMEKERESLLAKAVTSFSPRKEASGKSRDFDTRTILNALLNFMISENDSEAAGAQATIDDLAGKLLEEDIAMSTMTDLCETLACAILEQFGGKYSGAELGRLYGRLIESQNRLFRSYIDAENERRLKMARYQREIDRFPDTMAATLDPPTLRKVGLGKLKELVGMERGIIFSVDQERRLTHLAGDHVDGYASGGTVTLHGEAANLLLERGEPYWEGPGHENSCLVDMRNRGGATSMLLLPLVVRGRTTGVILLSDGPDRRRFSAEEIELASRFASRFAVALENASLHSREQHKIKETVALLEITRAINSTLDLKEILVKVAQMTVDLCGVVLCVVYLLEEQTGRLVPATHCGFIEEGLWEDERAYGFDLLELENQASESLRSGRPTSVRAHNASCLLPPDLTYEHGVDLVFMYPLNSKDKITGVFALFYPRRDEEIWKEEIEFIGAIAAQASMAIENAALYEDIERSYFSTVKALAKAIEVKDPYTHGHSERVTEYALMMADAMMLDEREKQKLKYAATLHDIGKIGIAGRVLNKPGELTDEEYSHVKTHPLLGDTIIEPVEFLQGPRPIILHHHERYDGKGYPQGLKGRDIPLCARILSVADAFEAMRSDRPYRRALPLETAKKELKRNAGTQFDPEVVEAFLGILETRGEDPVSRQNSRISHQETHDFRRY